MNRSAKLAISSTLMALLLGVGGCTIEKEEAGNLPEYDVKDADVDVGIEEQSVPLPDIDIEPER